MSIQKFIEQLDLRSSFVQAQLAAGVDVSVIQETQAKSLLLFLNSLRVISVEDVVVVANAINQPRLCWTDAQKQSLLAKVGDLVGGMRRFGGCKSEVSIGCT